MKKFLFFAAALLCLVACNDKNNAFNGEQPVQSIEPGQRITLTATVDLEGGNKVSPRMIAPDGSTIPTTEGTTLTFHWEEGDKVVLVSRNQDSIVTERQTFRLVSGEGSATATFEGTALQDMSSYEVYYNTPDTCFRNDTSKIAAGIAHDIVRVSSFYQPGSFKPFGIGTGKGTHFTLQLLPVLHFRLFTNSVKGDVTLNKIDGQINVTRHFYDASTMDCQSSPITLVKSSTGGDTVDVYFPVPFAHHLGFYSNLWGGFDAYVWDEAEKDYKKNLSSESYTFPIDFSQHMGEIINFPPLRIEKKAEACLAAGTRITMADGSTKLVENIVEGDLLRTFDHEAGCISSAKVCLTYKGESKATSLDLTFASGKKLAIVGTHDLLLENTRKYVRINSGNVASFVGKRFYNAESGKWDALVSYNTGTKVDYYCIYSAKHLNCIAEGLLTCPDDVDHILNIYSLDANLKADATQLAADIAQHGLCDIAKDFPEFAQHADQIEALGGQYVYIAIGKGLIPQSYIEEMKAYWRGL